YCAPVWISDYTYRAILDYRERFGGAVAAAPEPALLVWGRITADGRLVLEPAFEIMAVAQVPAGPGRYTLEVAGADGTRLAGVSFDGDVVDHDGGRHFAFAIPMRTLGGRPAVLRLSDGVAAITVRSGPGVAPGPGTAPAVTLSRTGSGLARLQWDG